MWACLVLGFRSLLRKSNLVTTSDWDNHIIRRSSVRFFPWGMLLSISSTKTIQFGQRTIDLPIAHAPESPLCAVYWVRQHIMDVPTLDSDQPLFMRRRGPVLSPVTYGDLLKYLKLLLEKSGRDPDHVGLHSLRRAGASYMHSIGLFLEDIRQAGDWKSLTALIYLATPLLGRIDVDHRVATSLQWLSHNV